MARNVEIGGRPVGDGHVVAETGINHNGDPRIAPG